MLGEEETLSVSAPPAHYIIPSYSEGLGWVVGVKGRGGRYGRRRDNTARGRQRGEGASLRVCVCGGEGRVAWVKGWGLRPTAARAVPPPAEREGHSDTTEAESVIDSICVWSVRGIPDLILHRVNAVCLSLMWLSSSVSAAFWQVVYSYSY